MLANQLPSQPRFVASAPATARPALYYAAKRSMDLIMGLGLLLGASPFMLVVAILIKLDSHGPVFFTQERVGAKRVRINGAMAWEIRRFRLYKFRSMVQHADQSLHVAHIAAFTRGQVVAGNGRARFKLSDDARITRVGRVLRRTSFDELPQLLNVVRGDMSLVGPRPVPTYEVKHYQSWQFERLAALPGMTGLWQVSGRSQLTFDEMIRLDLEYVRHQSLRLDAKILCLTLPAVLSGYGAE